MGPDVQKHLPEGEAYTPAPWPQPCSLCSFPEPALLLSKTLIKIIVQREDLSKSCSRRDPHPASVYPVHPGGSGFCCSTRRESTGRHHHQHSTRMLTTNASQPCLKRHVQMTAFRASARHPPKQALQINNWQAGSALGALSAACDRSHRSLPPCPDPGHPAEADPTPASPELPGTVSLCLLLEGPGLGSGAANFGKLWARTAAPRSPPGRRTSQLHVVRV